MFPDFFAVEHALKIKVVNTTSNIFFKFLLNIIFSPGFVMWFISNYLVLFKCILHKIQPYFDKREDQDGSEASVSVFTSLSLYPVKSIDQSFALKPSPLSFDFVSR